MKSEIRLPVDLYAPSQLSALLLELHDYINKLRSRAAHAKVKASHEEEDLTISPLLTTTLTTSGITSGNITQLEALHRGLNTLLVSSPVMHMTLAGMPGRKLKRQLTVWFRTQIHPTALLTFTVRSDIGGGFLLQAGSHFYDHSFRAKVLANPKRIGELAGV